VHLSRYLRRFGGEGTVVTLADGRAFTAAHCIAAVDGRPGRLIAAPDGVVWRVGRRWSPDGLDLAALHAVTPPPSSTPPTTLPARAMLRPGVEVVFYAPTARGFRARRARVISVTATSAVAEVQSRVGTCAGDSGGPVVMGDVLVGIVTHRLGRPRGPGGATLLRCVRLDAPAARVRLARHGEPPPRAAGP
jgi:hypothetical protein